jgi:hypothetical protein
LPVCPSDKTSGWSKPKTPHLLLYSIADVLFPRNMLFAEQLLSNGYRVIAWYAVAQ